MGKIGGIVKEHPSDKGLKKSQKGPMEIHKSL